MGIITRHVLIRGDLGETQVNALFDTGASSSLIRSDIAGTVASVSRLARPITFETAKAGTRAESHEGILAEVDIDGHGLPWQFYLISDLAEELIIGVDLMQRFKIRLDPEQEALSIDPEGLRFRIV